MKLTGRAFLAAPWARMAAVATLVGAAAGWLVYGVQFRSISTDDGISLMAAAAIRDQGLPLLPSGQLYNRAYLAHYVLALSTGIFGTGDVGILLPSLVAGVGTLALVHEIGRRMLGSSGTGLLAAFLLACSSMQMAYSVSPRMYGLLTFFTTWATYAAWRGFGEGSRRHRILALWVLALGLQCERGAGTLVAAVPLALFAIEPAPLRTRLTAIIRRHPIGVPEWSSALVLAGSMALAVFQPANALRVVIGSGGNPPDFFEFSLSPTRFFWHLLHLDGMLTGTLGLALLGAITAAGGAPGARFLLVMLAVPFVQVALVMDQTGHRIVLFLLPLYALFVAFGLASLVAAIRDRSLPPRLLIATLLAGALQGGAVLVAAQRPKAMKAVYASGYLLPDQSRQGHPEIERELRWLRTQVADEDLVLTSNPWISDHYVGKTDGIIRQHPNGARGFTTFPEPRDEYFGALIYDQIEELDTLLAGLARSQRVWIVLDTKADVYCSSEFRAGVAARLTRVNKSRRVRIYASAQPVPP